jgi:hypothetical protein
MCWFCRHFGLGKQEKTRANCQVAVASKFINTQDWLGVRPHRSPKLALAVIITVRQSE